MMFRLCDDRYKRLLNFLSSMEEKEQLITGEIPFAGPILRRATEAVFIRFNRSSQGELKLFYKSNKEIIWNDIRNGTISMGDTVRKKTFITELTYSLKHFKNKFLKSQIRKKELIVIAKDVFSVKRPTNKQITYVKTFIKVHRPAILEQLGLKEMTSNTAQHNGNQIFTTTDASFYNEDESGWSSVEESEAQNYDRSIQESEFDDSNIFDYDNNSSTIDTSQVGSVFSEVEAITLFSPEESRIEYISSTSLEEFQSFSQNTFSIPLSSSNPSTVDICEVLPPNEPQDIEQSQDERVSEAFNNVLNSMNDIISQITKSEDNIKNHILANLIWRELQFATEPYKSQLRDKLLSVVKEYVTLEYDSD